MDHFEYIHQNQVFSIDLNLKIKNILQKSTSSKKTRKNSHARKKENHHSILIHAPCYLKETQISHCLAGIILNKLRK
jgi:hypothetical protein